MLLRHTMLYLPAQLVGPAAGIVAAILWTHWLAPAPYGVLTFLVASQDLVFLLCMSWWTQFTLRYFDGLNGVERDKFTRSEASILALSFAVQIVATLLVLLVVHEPITLELATASVAYVSSRSVLTHLGERARAQSRIAIYTAGQFAGSLFGIAMAYAAVVFISATPVAVLGGYAVAQTIGVFLMWRWLGVAGGSLRPSADVLKAALTYGIPLLVAGGTAWIGQNSIRLVVEQLAGDAALGLIALGWGLGQRLTATLAMLVITASFPLAVKNFRGGTPADGYRQLSLGGILVMGLVLPASIGLCLLAQPFVTMFVAAPFRAMTLAVLPYAAAANALRNIRIHTADPVFLLIEKPRLSMVLNAVDAVAVFICCLFGLLLGGLVGAVAGCLVGTLVSVVAGIVLTKHAAGFTFPYRDAGKIIVASGLMGVVLVALPWSTFVLPPLTRMIGESLLGGFVYVAALAVLYPGSVQATGRRLANAYRVGTGVPLR